MQEMDNIQVEQKVVSCVSEKAKWWEGRRALDSRVEVSDEKGNCWGDSIVKDYFHLVIHFI